MRVKVILIDRIFSHHGQRSGYRQLGTWLNAERLSPNKLAYWAVRRVPDRWLFHFPLFHPNWYDREAFALEVQAACRAVVSEHVIFHALYGEHSLRWIAIMNRLAGHRNRVVATYHQVPSFFERRRQQFLHIKYLDAAILVASNQEGFFKSMMPSERVYVIPHGVDTDFFRPLYEQIRPSRPQRCLTVGSNYRDFGMLLKVIENIKHSQLNDTEFIIVGDPIYERQFAGLENVRYLYGIPDSELLLLYQSSDILLLPLKDATACNALLEGLSCALPIIVTDVGGVRDYVDETCAILTPPGDAEAMTEHLLGLLRDEQQRYKIGRSARRRAVERFRWALIAERVREIYTRLW